MSSEEEQRIALMNVLLGFDNHSAHKEEVREIYHKSAWSQPGSKYKHLHKILPELPYGKVWVEGCVGGGVVTLNRRASDLEIINDKHSGITTFYRAVRDDKMFDQLLARLKTVLHSREEFIWCRDTWANCDDTVERAARWYYMIRTSFNQIGRNFGRSNKGEPMIPRKYWRSFRHFPHIHQRLMDVQIENLDAVQCLKDFDGHFTVGYFDPDYDETCPGVYQHGVDHIKLLDAVMDAKGFYAVSAYPNTLYDSYKWTKVKKWEGSTSIKSASKTETGHLKDKNMKRDTTVEALYIRDYK